jgi:hypothetical protein
LQREAASVRPSGSPGHAGWHPAPCRQGLTVQCSDSLPAAAICQQIVLRAPLSTSGERLYRGLSARPGGHARHCALAPYLRESASDNGESAWRTSDHAASDRSCRGRTLERVVRSRSRRGRSRTRRDPIERQAASFTSTRWPERTRFTRWERWPDRGPARAPAPTSSSQMRRARFAPSSDRSLLADAEPEDGCVS